MSEHDDAPRTVFMPSPGGRQPGGRHAGGLRPPPPPPGAAAAGAAHRFGVNPLVDAAGEVLELVVYLRGQTQAMDVAKLHDDVTALLRDFERRAMAVTTDRTAVKDAHFVLCATIDDVVLSSPWGFDAAWQANPLVSALHGNVTGGEQFFETLQQAQRDPARSQNLLELMYICLSLGFRGKYRRDTQGLGELEQRRDNLYHDIDTQRHGITEVLSPRWRGEETTRTPPRDYFPVWLIGAVAAAVVAAFFIIATFATHSEVASALERAENLPPNERVEIVRAALVPDPVPIKKPPPPDTAVVLTGLLQELIDEQVIDPPEAVGSALRIRVRSSSPQRGVMFNSGKADVQSAYRTVLTQISQALAAETTGDITVRGHSDLQPMRERPPFFNNKGLSEARASNAADVMWGTLSNTGRRVFFEGVGEAEPLGTGNSAAVHARNRRIDIMLPIQDTGTTIGGARP